MADTQRIWFLAQDSNLDIHQIVQVCLVLLVVFVLALVGALYMRRWSRSSDAVPPRGFALDELRKLHREGKMSEEEFKRTSALVAQAQRAQLLPPAADRPKPPKAGK